MIAKIVVRQTKTVIRVTKAGDGSSLRLEAPGKVIRVSRMGLRGPRGANHPAQLVFSVAGPLPGSPANIYQFFTPIEQMTIDPSGIYAEAGTAPTNQYTLTVERVSDGAVVVRFVWGAGQTVPVVTVPIPVMVPGERLRWTGSMVPDASLRDVSITIPALRAEND